MTSKWRPQRNQLGARSVRQRHGGQRDAFQIIQLKRNQKVMWQRRQRVGHRLARMARRVKAITRHQRRQMRSEHGNGFRRRCQSRTGPKPGCDGQARYPIARSHRNNDQVQLHIAVDIRNTVGFQHQRGNAPRFKPVDGNADAIFRKHGRIADPRQSKAVGPRTVAADPLMRQYRHVIMMEPPDQGRAFAIRQAVGVGGQGGEHVAPIRHRAAHIGKNSRQMRRKLTAFLCVNARGFEVNEGFARLPIVPFPADGCEHMGVITGNAQHRMNDAIHRYAAGGNGGRHRIHQKGHVVIIQRYTHHQTAMRIGKAIQCNGRSARLAMQARFDCKTRGILCRFGVKTLIFAWQSRLGKGADHIFQKGLVDFCGIFSNFGGRHEMIS